MASPQALSGKGSEVVGTVLAMVALAIGFSFAAVSAQEESEPTASACAKGVVQDDGTVETGYGFVPSSTEGIYVQELTPAALGQPYLDSACVCWLKTRGEHDIDFEVVVYESQNGRPSETPLYSVAARADSVAKSVAEAGAFVQVDLGRLPVPEGPFFLGVRWSPKEEAFLFVCVDQSAETEKTRVFFRESAVPKWVAVTESRDPIFLPHRAIMVRAVGTSAPPRPATPQNASSPPTLAPPE